MCHSMSNAKEDTSSEITPKNLKKVVEEANNGRDAPANEDTNEKNGEQKVDNKIYEKKKKG